jgi:hypothetical protein
MLLNLLNFAVQKLFLELEYENSKGKQILVSSIKQAPYVTSWSNRI